ncbi:uncharacterized [Lates japonicus]
MEETEWWILAVEFEPVMGCYCGKINSTSVLCEKQVKNVLFGVNVLQELDPQGSGMEVSATLHETLSKHGEEIYYNDAFIPSCTTNTLAACKHNMNTHTHSP